MSNQTRVSHPTYNLPPTEIGGFDDLAELALDMRWSWNHATDDGQSIAQQRAGLLTPCLMTPLGLTLTATLVPGYRPT